MTSFQFRSFGGLAPFGQRLAPVQSYQEVMFKRVLQWLVVVSVCGLLVHFVALSSTLVACAKAFSFAIDEVRELSTFSAKYFVI